jgi:hypothetical protein
MSYEDAIWIAQLKLLELEAYPIRGAPMTSGSCGSTKWSKCCPPSSPSPARPAQLARLGHKRVSIHFSTANRFSIRRLNIEGRKRWRRFSIRYSRERNGSSATIDRASPGSRRRRRGHRRRLMVQGYGDAYRYGLADWHDHDLLAADLRGPSICWTRRAIGGPGAAMADPGRRRSSADRGNPGARSAGGAERQRTRPTRCGVTAARSLPAAAAFLWRECHSRLQNHLLKPRTCNLCATGKIAAGASVWLGDATMKRNYCTFERIIGLGLRRCVCRGHGRQGRPPPGSLFVRLASISGHAGGRGPQEQADGDSSTRPPWFANRGTTDRSAYWRRPVCCYNWQWVWVSSVSKATIPHHCRFAVRSPGGAFETSVDGLAL